MDNRADAVDRLLIFGMVPNAGLYSYFLITVLVSSLGKEKFVKGFLLEYTCIINGYI